MPFVETDEGWVLVDGDTEPTRITNEGFAKRVKKRRKPETTKQYIRRKLRDMLTKDNEERMKNRKRSRNEE